MTLWEYTSGFSSDDWTQHIGYLWMIDPMIDRRMAGKPKSIDKYSRPFDLQLIKEEHGSGNYRLDFCRIARNGNAQKRIHQEYFGIIDMKYPPRLPYGEWLTWPENKDWLWAAPLLKKEADEVRIQAEGSNKSTNDAADAKGIFNTILQGVQTLRGDSSENEGLAAAVLGMVSANQDRMMALSDPVKQMGTIKALLADLTPKHDDSGLKLIVDLLREDLKEARKESAEVRRELAEIRNAPQKDLLSQMIDNAPKLKEVAAFLGFSGKSSSGTDWGGIVANAVDKLSDHVPAFMEAWKYSKTAAGQAPAAVTPFRPGVVTNNTPQVSSPAPAAAAAAPPPTAPEGGATPPPAAADDASEAERIEAAKKRMAFANGKYGNLLKTVAPHLVDHFRSEMTGYDFRDWLIDRHGRNNWTALRDEVGPETLCQLAMAHPMLRPALSSPDEANPGEKLFRWLQEVFTAPGKEDADRLSPAVEDPDADPNREADIPADPETARRPAA
jgi:hypothetical protein